jgi:hypothetical protein
MRSSKVKLAEWLSEKTSYIDIPWPLVHDQAGIENIKWLNSQDPFDVQIVLEKREKTGTQVLWAEFYKECLLYEYIKINNRCESKS